MNLLLDTNVLIDYLGRKSPFYATAQKPFIAALYGDVKLWIASQSVVDAFYVLSKYIDSMRLQELILRALELVTPVDLVGADLKQAARLGWPDMEDCLVAIAADKARVDCLVTRDTKGFDRSMVQVLSPTEWVDLMEREYGLAYDEINL